MTKQKEHIARISYGKDSLKMLDVIYSRGLPLDRITTTDVWATDTISARLPPMDSFVDRMDQWIWDHYRIKVEHLCAVNKDGTKKTYEQLFYHVPVRRSQICNVEREREREPVQPRRSQRVAGHRKTVVSERSQTICQNTAGRVRLPDFHRIPDTTGARSSNTHPAPSPAFQSWGDPGARGASSPECRNNGFPAQISPWCRKLKIDKVKTPFLRSAPRGAKI